MRLRRLDLSRYGIFTDHEIDFGAPTPGAPDLHVIYGPNEAGKSTALSGFLDLLFAFEHRSRYGFAHGYDAMRVEADLEIGNETRRFARAGRGTPDSTSSRRDSASSKRRRNGSTSPRAPMRASPRNATGRKKPMTRRRRRGPGWRPGATTPNAVFRACPGLPKSAACAPSSTLSSRCRSRRKSGSRRSGTSSSGNPG